jgi:hypothetical protein
MDNNNKGCCARCCHKCFMIFNLILALIPLILCLYYNFLCLKKRSYNESSYQYGNVKKNLKDFTNQITEGTNPKITKEQLSYVIFNYFSFFQLGNIFINAYFFILQYFFLYFLIFLFHKYSSNLIYFLTKLF